MPAALNSRDSTKRSIAGTLWAARVRRQALSRSLLTNSGESAGESHRRLEKPVPRLAKFHLDPTSSLADAPSIGTRPAQKLAAVGIRTFVERVDGRENDPGARVDQIDSAEVPASVAHGDIPEMAVT